MKLCNNKCGLYNDTSFDMCPDCLAKSLSPFWQPKNCNNIEVSSDGEKFIATITSGIGFDTFLSVGYSSPNNALIKPEYVDEISSALDDEWEQIEKLELEEMLPNLLKLVKAANRIYNNIIERAKEV